jgi:Bacteriophage head to tail connecting protein.
MRMEDLRKVQGRFREVWSERQDWEPSWKGIRRMILPFRGQFDDENPKDGRNRAKDLLNGSAMRSARTLAAGLQSGVTSPARPWFRLSVSDMELGDLESVRGYTDEVERRMMGIFARSNLYNSLHSLYLELAGFATGAMMIVEDFRTGIRCRTFTAGEYALGMGADLRVNTFARKLKMTTVQLVQEFGKVAVPDEARRDYGAGMRLGRIWEVCQLIEPNEERDVRRKDNRNMEFRSVYWVSGEDEPLRVSGFREFPVVVPRWDVVANQAYGRGPGWEALGDVRQLQKLEEDGLVALAKMVNPPMMAPDGVRHINVMPGGVTRYSDLASGGRAAIHPLYQIQPDLGSLRAYVGAKEQAIREAFYVDLFAMLSSYGGPQMTAQEVIERHEEKMIMLGPVLERLHAELLDPLIARVYEIMSRSGLLPEVPEELGGADLKVEYVSVLAQAQKMVAMRGIQDFMGFVGQVSGLSPEVAERVDYGELVDRAAEALGVPKGIILGREEFEAKQAQAQQEAQMAQEMMMAKESAGIAKDLGSVEAGGLNGIEALLGGMGNVGENVEG